MKPEDFMNQAEPSRIIVPGQPQQQQPDPLQMIAMETQRLNMGMAHMSRTNALVGKAVDMCQLSLQLILNILVDKEVIEKDELESRYQEQVIDRYKAMEEEAKKFAEDQMKEQQEAQKQELEDMTEESDKMSDAVVSDAEDNVRHIVKEK